MILTDNERVMSNKPLFSVVTVCYNAENYIQKTMESVLAQDYLCCGDSKSSDSDIRFEYIIQDGASKDGTLELISKFKDKFEDKNIGIVINSEKDGGIYDAMNKAVSSASGTYVIFMNADDCFYSESVLSDVARSLDKFNDDNSELPDIIYGDCIVKELGMYFTFKKCFDDIKSRMPFSHQACFAKAELLKELQLNTNYKITADYDFLLRSCLNSKTFYDSNVTIALVTADGLSSLNMLDTFVEVNKVCSALNEPRFSEKEYKKKLREMKLKQFVLSHFPKFIVKAVRKKQISKRGQLADVVVPVWAR